MADNLNRNVIMKALDYGYDKAVNGLPGMETAEEMAQSKHPPPKVGAFKIVSRSKRFVQKIN